MSSPCGLDRLGIPTAGITIAVYEVEFVTNPTRRVSKRTRGDFAAPLAGRGWIRVLKALASSVAGFGVIRGPADLGVAP
jgi:hypothetical protein